MEREFFPREETVLYEGHMFCWLNSFLNYAEYYKLSEALISEVLSCWPMPNDPVRSEN